MTEAALAARDIEFTFSDGRQAIRGVSLEIARGEPAGLIGPNGAGKTTLIHVLAGLLKPQRGTVEVFGEPIGVDGDAGARRRIGLVFQQTEDQLFSPTVFDDVAFGPLNYGFPRGEVHERVRDALRRVGLEQAEDRVPHHLSSGERRRAAIATVLSFDPEILILDEPTSDLDPRGRRDLARLLGSMSQARFVAAHDLELILLTCRRVLLIDEGKIRADGPAAEIIGDHRLLEAHGLEAPFGLRGLGARALEDLIARERSDG
ncbi:MAG: ABC transporter ATP-binding protein [Planctomycetes bacterium]|nr:ABC transporter ATP-binding protein [Planctomycetota bacterium]